MKIFISSLLLLFGSALFAQQNSDKSTFHVKSTGDNKYAVFFSINTDGIFKEMTIMKNGNAYFAWINSNIGNTNSASFSGDTVLIDTIKKIITPVLINSIQQCLDKNRSSYSQIGVISINDNDENYKGVAINSDIYSVCSSERLTKLIKIMDALYRKYGFPK